MRKKSIRLENRPGKEKYQAEKEQGSDNEQQQMVQLATRHHILMHLLNPLDVTKKNFLRSFSAQQMKQDRDQRRGQCP